MQKEQMYHQRDLEPHVPEGGRTNALPHPLQTAAGMKGARQGEALRAEQVDLDPPIDQVSDDFQRVYRQGLEIV